MGKLKRLAAVLSASVLLTLPCTTSMIYANASTVADVIATAREIGMPEDEINAYIAQYGSGTYTSEQCDQAIAALQGMRGQYANAATEGNTTSAASDDTIQSTTETESETNKFSEKIDEFFDKSSEDKIRYILEMTDSDANEFWDVLTDDQKESVKAVLNADSIDDLKESAQKAADELGLTIENSSESESESLSEVDTESETITSETITETDESTEETETISKAVASATSTMIWIIIAVILAVVVVFIVIAYVLKKNNNSEE